ncbi:CsgE family curli-type amyloid fiber assembly protein [Larkinella soli]|uniref:CsgE family curli-type amyloid fiber assembly protein n=1 Tax=Larkinella soli TaxID=1770527 RepID=UPI000FFC77EA|nr:CsgE family curli-type amyloid fiber assembly protein [Larkinella soli]
MKTVLIVLLLAFAARPQASAQTEPAPETTDGFLLLDQTRTKTGRDFYDLFFKHWSARQADSDTLETPLPVERHPPDDAVLLIEELPSPGTGNLIRISLDDRPVWQRFVPARYEALEGEAAEAVGLVAEQIKIYFESVEKPEESESG